MKIRVFCAFRVEIRIFVISVFLLTTTLSSAQQVGLTDTIRNAFDKKPSISFRLNTRNSFVTGKPIATRGAKVGWSFGDKVSVGAGVHWIEHNTYTGATIENGIPTLSEVRMMYGSVFFEYSFIYKKRWQVFIPVQLGVGVSRNRYFNNAGVNEFREGGAVILYEPGMIAEYSFLKYFGVGAGGGVRLMLLNNRRIDEQLTAPIWEVRFKVRFGELLNDLGVN